MVTIELSNQAAPAPIDSFELLDPFSGGLVAPRKQQPTLATISAGYNANAGKDNRKQPVVSRDGTIYIDGRADLVAAQAKVPGLVAALERGGRKRLTVTFPWDDPRLFIQQFFTCRSASHLQVYGDQTGLTRIRHEEVNRETGERRALARPTHDFYPAGSAEWRALLPHIKTETSVYFFLAGWQDGQAQVLFPDGLGLYRLRMTGHNSAHNLVNSLKWISTLTRGRFAGVPFELWHEPTEVPGPDGARRVVPVWQLFPRPPETMQLSAENFQQIFGGALLTGDRLKVLPPPLASPEALESEGPADDAPILDGGDGLGTLDGESAAPTDGPTPEQQAAFNAAVRAGLCDPERVRRQFFATYGDTVLNDDGPRAVMMREYTHGDFDSLSEYLADATTGEAANLLAFAKLWLARQAEAARPQRTTFRQTIQHGAIEGSVVGPELRPEPAADPWVGDLLEFDRDERATLMVDLQAKLDEAAVVGMDVEELDLARLSNAELAGVVSGLTARIAEYRGGPK